MVQIQIFSLYLLLFLSLEETSGQKCVSSVDCESPYAPHCSKWGWCQWTHQFGVQGPDDQNLNNQQDNINMTETEMPRVRIDPRPRTRSYKGDTEGSKNSTSLGEPSDSIIPANTILLQRSIELTANKKEPHGMFGVKTSITQLPITSPTINPSHRRRKTTESDNIQTEDDKYFYRRRRKSKPVQKFSTKERAALPLFKDVSAIRNSPAFITTKPATTPARIERQSLDYSVGSHPLDYYEYYNPDNYDYYTEFEVLKMEPKTDGKSNNNQNQINKSTERSINRNTESSCTNQCINGVINKSDNRKINQNSESSKMNTAEAIKENPSPGESQGCLYDCVYDCVSIIKLTAYRDCVNFCGRTCKDK